MTYLLLYNVYSKLYDGFRQNKEKTLISANFFFTQSIMVNISHGLASIFRQSPSLPVNLSSSFRFQLFLYQVEIFDWSCVSKQNPLCLVLPCYRWEGSQAQLHHSVLFSEVHRQLWFSSNAIQVMKEKCEEENICPKRIGKSAKEVKWHPTGEGIYSLNASLLLCLYFVDTK